MISSLGLLVQFSPATGRVGRCRQISLCGEHSQCSSHTGFALYRGVCAFPVYTAQALGCSIWSGPCVECGSSFWVLHKSADSIAPAFCVFPSLSGPGSQRLGRSFPGCGVPFPCAVSGSGSQRLGCPLPGCSAPFPSAASGSGSQRLGCTLSGCGMPFPSAASGSGSQRLLRPLPGCGAPFLSATSGSGSQRLGYPLPGCGAPFPSAASGPGSQRRGCPLPGCGAPLPSAEKLASSRDPPSCGFSGSLYRNREPVCSVGGGGFSGAEFALFPNPLPPTSSGDGPALLWSFSVPLFCEPPAVCSGWLIFSLAVPQFKRAPSDCSQGPLAGPYPKQCPPLLSVSPPLGGGGCGRLGYFSAGSCF